MLITPLEGTPQLNNPRNREGLAPALSPKLGPPITWKVRMMVENWFTFVAISLLITASCSFVAYWRGYAKMQRRYLELLADAARLEKTANALAQANIEAQLDVALARMGLR